MRRKIHCALLIGISMSMTVFANESPEWKCGGEKFLLFSEAEIKEYSLHSQGKQDSKNISIQEAVKMNTVAERGAGIAYRDHKGEIDG